MILQPSKLENHDGNNDSDDNHDNYNDDDDDNADFELKVPK